MLNTRLAPCGTLSGYQRHLAVEEEPCSECEAAWFDYGKRHITKATEASLPLEGPEYGHHAPCFGASAEDNLWDPQRENEPKEKTYARHKQAQKICLTACPVFEACREAKKLVGPSDSVWAGEIPGER